MKCFRRVIKIGIVVAICICLWQVVEDAYEKFVAWSNGTLEVSYYKVQTEVFPDELEDLRIVHISDLHYAEFGEKNQELIAMVKTQQPDIIVMTGDMLDSMHVRPNMVLNFAKETMKIAPCYYVIGNNEVELMKNLPGAYESFENKLTELGVTVLRDTYVEYSHEGVAIQIIGIDDPELWWLQINEKDLESEEKISKTEVAENGYKERLEKLVVETDSLQIMLSHRPEYFELYCESGVDVVFSGHAHGGQFRIPGVGGVYAPNQGLFPKYDAGLYTEENTNMVVSRGLGNSAFPFRINNPPEIVVVDIQ